jgi:hypothetical protein
MQLIRALECPSAACTNSLNFPLMHLFDVPGEATLFDKCRAPVPGASYLVIYLSDLRNGSRQLLVGSG